MLGARHPVRRVLLLQLGVSMMMRPRAAHVQNAQPAAGHWAAGLPGVAYGRPTVGRAGAQKKTAAVFVGVVSRRPPVAALALRASDGRQLWNYTLSHCRYEWPGGRCGSLGGLALSPDGETAYLGADDFQVHALGTATGQARWNTSLGAHIAGKPAVSADGTLVYAATSRKPTAGFGSHRVWALRAESGAVAWEYAVPNGGGFFASPSIATGRVFIGTSGAGVHEKDQEQLGST
eukprot:SAG22_NODE_474_length_10034_cov_21.356517_5_plen_234_part_00